MSQNKTSPQKSFQALRSQVASQQKRLQSLSNTSREDWVLAEAEYLLRLANQRLLMERGTRGAEALLNSADNILLDLDQVDLLPVRDSLRREIISLKVAGQIDREGLYLRLSAVAGILDNLPLVNSATVRVEVPPSISHVEQDQAEPDTTALDTFGSSLRNAIGSFSDYIRVTRDNENLEPILNPEYQFYVKQNARLMIERAQLALMREETEIYRGSIEQAHFWLNKFYRQSSAKESLLEELLTLQKREIKQSLPDLSRSLEMLRAYIDNLHALSPSAKPARSKET